MSEFTEREREIAELLARGLTQAEIAQQLCIATSTCYRHTLNMRRRVGATTAAIAVQAAVELGVGGQIACSDIAITQPP